MNGSFMAGMARPAAPRRRNVKMSELFYNPDGTIKLIDPFVK